MARRSEAPSSAALKTDEHVCEVIHSAFETAFMNEIPRCWNLNVDSRIN